MAPVDGAHMRPGFVEPRPHFRLGARLGPPGHGACRFRVKLLACPFPLGKDLSRLILVLRGAFRSRAGGKFPHGELSHPQSVYRL